MASEEDRDDGQDDEVLGARVGLALVAALGTLFGAATSLALWMCYPPARGQQWPLPTIGVVSLVALGAGYLTLRRRVGPGVADWFALGYVLALVGFAALVMGGQAVEVVRDRVAAALSV